MPRIICIANQKGGVGKTTTAICLSDALAKSGMRTLLIDFDPQCNATSGLGLEPGNAHPLVSGEPLASGIRQTGTEGLDILPGTRKFADVDAMARSDKEFAERVREQIARELNTYDFVLIDCPPSLGHLTQMALNGASEILIPIQCEYFAMEGVVQMVEIVGEVMREKELAFTGILMTMVDHRLEVTYEIDHQVRDFFGEEIVFKTVIPRDVALNEAPSHGLSIIDYAPRSRGARAYVELCMEVLERV